MHGVEFFELKIRISPRKRIFEQTFLACLSGAQVGSIHEKKIANKSRDPATLVRR